MHPSFKLNWKAAALLLASGSLLAGLPAAGRADATTPPPPARDAPAAAAPSGADQSQPMMPDNADPVQRVVLTTTHGDIVIAVHEAWAPLGAAHFLELVRAGFYDAAPWFRVIDAHVDPYDPQSEMRPFVAQCGIAADPAVNAEWRDKTLQDEPVLKGSLKGTVAFGKSGRPNSRSTHIYINLSDNSKALDPQGFAAFGEVVEGLDIAEGLARVEFRDQAQLASPGGMEAFKAAFPQADYILTARVDSAGQPGQ